MTTTNSPHNRFRLSLTEQDATTISAYLTSPELAVLPQPLAVRKFIVKLAEFLDRIANGEATPIGIPATAAAKFTSAELELIEAIRLEQQLGVSVGAQQIAHSKSLDFQHYWNLVTEGGAD